MSLTFHFTHTLPSCLLFSSFPLNLPQQGTGTRGCQKTGLQGVFDSADHQRPRAAADRKEMKGQRWRASRCLQLRHRSARCPQPPGLRGSHAVDGGPGQVQWRARVVLGGGGAGGGGGLCPSCLFHPSISFAWGTDHRKKCI